MIHSSGRQSQIAFAHYVISIEDLPGTISADLHGHSFRYSSSDHVANCSSPQIMKGSFGARQPGDKLFSMHLESRAPGFRSLA